jgi:hypothetical protein
MESPQTHLWGPALWMILHSSAERIGLAKAKMLQYDEIRLWSGPLSSLRYSLPCPVCKKHYSDYYAAHSISEYTRPVIRQWLFNLHQQVNGRTNNTIPSTIDNLPDIYGKPFHFSKHADVVQHHMKLAISHRWCERNDVQRTARFLEEMKRLYDLF